MNKKVLGLAVILLAFAILAVPVMANPTQGQKVPVTMSHIMVSTSTPVEHESGPVLHRQFEMNSIITIEIKDDEGTVVTTLTGTAVVDRKVVGVPQPNKWDGPLGKIIMIDYYVITIDTKIVDSVPESVSGGFEGNDM